MVGLGTCRGGRAVGAIILIGSGKGFSGGADIREFGTPQANAEPNLTDAAAGHRAVRKPVIAAIEGICVGGGLEMALACHYRVAGTNAQIALPEVKLGLAARRGRNAASATRHRYRGRLEYDRIGRHGARGQAAGHIIVRCIAEGDLLTSALDSRGISLPRNAAPAGCGTGACDAERRGIFPIRTKYDQSSCRPVSGADGLCRGRRGGGAGAV